MRYQVTHLTTYRYHDAVAVSHNLAHLVPIDLPCQQVLGHRLTVTPEPTHLDQRRDWFGNQATTIVIERPHHDLVVGSHATIERHAPAIPEHTPAWESIAAESSDPAVEYRFASPLVPLDQRLRDFAAACFVSGRSVLEAAQAVMHQIHRDFRYEPASTTVSTPVLEALATRRGVCQDFALVLIGCLRAWGIPARYVSGYLETTPPPGKARLVGADATHAWAQVWTGAAWVDLDPTNDCLPHDRHLTVAIGRDFNDVSPLRGMVLGGGTAQVAVAVDVVRV